MIPASMGLCAAEAVDANRRMARQHIKIAVAMKHLRGHAGGRFLIVRRSRRSGPRPREQSPEVPQNWLVVEALPDAPQVSTLDARMTAWFLANRVIQPDTARLGTLPAKAERRLERALHRKISGRLTAQQKRNLDGLPVTGETASSFAMLARSPGGAGVKAVKDVVTRLDRVRRIGPVHGIFSGIHPEHIAILVRRAASEDAWDMRRHPDPVL